MSCPYAERGLECRTARNGQCHCQTLKLTKRKKHFRSVWLTSTLHNISRKARTQRYIERCAFKGAL